MFKGVRLDKFLKLLKLQRWMNMKGKKNILKKCYIFTSLLILKALYTNGG